MTVLFLSCSYQGKVHCSHMTASHVHHAPKLAFCADHCVRAAYVIPSQTWVVQLPWGSHSLRVSSLHVQEFIRVGYYINNEYWEEELRETPPERPIIER